MKGAGVSTSSRGIGRWLRRSAAVAPAVVALVAVLLAAPFHRPTDGSLVPLGWTVVLAGLALSIIAAAWGTRWWRSGLAAALALVGQASALALIDAPNYGVLQHYAPWRELLTTPRGLFLLTPLAQTAVLISLGWRQWRMVQTGFRRLLSAPRAALLALLFMAVAANGSFDLPRYASELLLGLWLLVVNGLNLILVAATVPEHALVAAEDGLRRRFAAPGPDVATSRWDRAYPWAVAAVVTAAGTLIAWVVFERIPHIPDSVSHLFQAKYFSVGRLYLPAPPDPAAFDFLKFYSDGTKWWAYTFPGWPAVLAIGVLVGLPWLVNPLLAGLCVLLAHALLKRLYDRTFAHAVITLLALSPWFLFMSGTFLPHTAALLWLLAALLAVQRARAAAAGRWGLLAGVFLGALFLTRPLDALLAGPVIGLWAIGWSGRRLAVRGIAGMAVGGLIVAGLLFPYNNALTGHPLHTPHSISAGARWYPGGDRLGFGPDVGNLGWVHLDPLPGHGPIDVILNAHQNLFMTNFELFGWSCGSLVLVALLLLWQRLDRNDRLFLGLTVAIAAGYGVYWFSGGPDFGARYWYLILIPLVVLTARGLQEARRRWPESGGSTIGSARVSAFVVAASLIALINVMPWRSLGKYHNYRDMSADMARLARTCQFGHSLVFVRGNDISDYPAALIFNPPTLESPGTIYARDLGPENRQSVAQHFPERPVWIVAADPATAGRFTVVDGPKTRPEACRGTDTANTP